MPGKPRADEERRAILEGLTSPATPPRPIQFRLWTLFLATTIVAVLAAGCSGAFGRSLQELFVVGILTLVLLSLFLVLLLWAGCIARVVDWCMIRIGQSRNRKR
jgi:hypothetical protein